MIQFNPNIKQATLNSGDMITRVDAGPKSEVSFADTAKQVGKLISDVDDAQQSSDASIKEMLTGENPDVTSVVSAVAKADMSFKLLVGVRNKLIEAYKQTMNMQI